MVHRSGYSSFSYYCFHTEVCFSKMEAGGMSSGVKYEGLLFDMDDTLYPMSSGLNLACRKNIEEFMLQRLHIEESEVPKMCLELYREHGTTMAGLKALGYEFDNDEFHAYVHGKLPYEALVPDLVLRNLLLSMPQRKIIFTNADKAHVVQVLNRLGLEDCFEGVICFETLNPPSTLEPPVLLLIDNSCKVDTEGDSDGTGNGACSTTRHYLAIEEPTSTTKYYDEGLKYSKSPILCKPSVEAIEAAIRIANVDPRKTIFFDDSARNIASGKAAGLHTVIVGSSEMVPGSDHALSSIHNIREALPEIWEGSGEEEGVIQQLEQVIQSGAVETVVIA